MSKIEEKKIKIGWAEVDITPNCKIGLAGQFYERITEVIESPLSVTAFAVDSGDEQMIICSTDTINVSHNLNVLVKERLNGKLPFSTDKIIINSIHSHTSYVYDRRSRLAGNSFSYLKQVLPKDMEYQALVSNEECLSPENALEFLANKICEAILSAWNNRDDGYYQFAFGRAVVGMCRRVCYDDGTAKMWGETNHANFDALEGGNDSGIELIYVYDKDKNLNGVVANIACPAQVVEQRSFVSSDYWGKVKENLRKHFGKNLFLLALCSAAGDQCPRDLIRWVEPETPIDDPNVKHLRPIEHRADPSMYDISGLKLIGKRISNEIISVFEELDERGLKNTAEFVHESLKVNIPLRKVTISEYEDAKEKIDRFIKDNRGKHVTYEENAMLYVYSGIIDRYIVQKTVEELEQEIHVIRFGDVAICTNPYELFLDYGNQIRAKSKAKQTFIIQLACGAEGYLPTEKAEKGGHYSAYVSGGTAGHIGGDILVRTTLRHINDMF